MLTKNERIAKLNEAGINTSKYFTVDLDNGTKIHLIIDENGNPKLVDKNTENDNIYKGIIEDGYVRNTRLHRRWIMAHMFAALNYVSWDGKYRGYNDCLKMSYSYDYTLKMMLDEVKVLSKLEVRDRESFEERSHFFTREIIQSVLTDYVEKLKEYVDKLPTKNCKGVPYKRIKNKDIFVEDLGKKLYQPIISDVNRIRYAQSYTEVYRILECFMRKMIKLPHRTPKSKAWIDAFKGEGAYYTMKNMVMYHNCVFYNDYNYPMYGNTMANMNHLKSKLDDYYGEGWRMFAMMKKLIEDNNFNFSERMREIYDK